MYYYSIHVDGNTNTVVQPGRLHGYRQRAPSYHYNFLGKVLARYCYHSVLPLKLPAATDAMFVYIGLARREYGVRNC